VIVVDIGIIEKNRDDSILAEKAEKLTVILANVLKEHLQDI
jgi:hypothetical protein